MTIKELDNEYDMLLNEFDHLFITCDDAWADESGKEHAKYNGMSVYLDCEDKAIRKSVFCRNVLRVINKNNWHTDIIKTIDDVDTQLGDCKIFVVYNSGCMFPKYSIFLKSDKEAFDNIRNEGNNKLTTLWKTDMEFLRDCIIDTVKYSCFDNWYNFVNIFNDNEYDIKFSDIESNEEYKKIFLEVIFEKLADTKNYDEDLDD